MLPFDLRRLNYIYSVNISCELKGNLDLMCRRHSEAEEMVKARNLAVVQSGNKIRALQDQLTSGQDIHRTEIEALNRQLEDVQVRGEQTCFEGAHSHSSRVAFIYIFDVFYCFFFINVRCNSNMTFSCGQERYRCLQAVNQEQARQLNEEMTSLRNSRPESESLLNSNNLRDNLLLKQEVSLFFSTFTFIT